VPKSLIVVNGPMGVGKTTVCQLLVESLPGSTAWLDGDWCWMMHPFRVTDENKRMVEDNIAHVLRGFLDNSSFDQVVFSWVIHRTEILDNLLSRLGDVDFRLCWYTLVADPLALRERIVAEGGGDTAIEASLERLPLYASQPSRKIDTTGRSVADVVGEIRRDLMAGALVPSTGAAP